MIRKVREKQQSLEKEFQYDLKAAGITVTQRKISSEMYRNHLHFHTPCKSEQLRNNVVWSDKTKMKLLGNNSAQHIWGKKDCAYDPKNT